MKDVNILASHINTLPKASNKIVNTLHQHASHISSFMKVMDERTTNLITGIQTNYDQNSTYFLTAPTHRSKKPLLTFLLYWQTKCIKAVL